MLSQDCFIRIYFQRLFILIIAFIIIGSAFSQTGKKSNPDSLVPYRIGAKWGFSDVNGKIIIKPEYQSVSFFYNKLAIVQKHNHYYLIDSKNRKASKKKFSEASLSENCFGRKCYEVKEKNNAYNLDVNGNRTDEGCGCMIDMQSNQYDYLDHPLTKDTIIEDAKLEYFANDPSKTIYGEAIFPVFNKGFDDYFIIENEQLYGLIYNDGIKIKQVFEANLEGIDFYKTATGKKRFIVTKDEKSAVYSETENLIPYKYRSIAAVDLRENMLWVETESNHSGFVNVNGFEYFKD